MKKEIIRNFMSLNQLKDVNWALQMKHANTLLKKHSYIEILYAIHYFAKKGIQMNSLGFLLYKNNIEEAVSMYKAEMNAPEREGSGNRNKQRIEQLRKAEYRENYPCGLFTEPRDNN